ncbi:class I SAM-dependent RNA methyltransferase [Acidisphaera sp. S103]|uniref:class I SAM-dependent RNA methyltransferase n=1 Tax=Acidisphaera sp. S103 TaxID=1747223 RepID=UPI00131AFB24|nr:TRAM domain-containing protein [Acidisphaera sp. S103]
MAAHAPKPSRRKPPEPAQVRIDRVGSEGDGIAKLPDGTPLYLPFTLPGETVTARPLQSRGDGWHAFAETIADATDARVEPPCRHFGRCGGCVLQHWRDSDYRAWKAGLVSYALRQAGFATPPDPMPFVPGLPGERRRIDFAVRRTTGRIILGLHEQRSAEVIDITDCLVLHPALMALLGPLRALLQGLNAVRREGSIVINLLDSGPDMLLRTDAALTLEDRIALTDFARDHGLPRVSQTLGGDTPETIGLLRPPTTTLSGVSVRPPPGVFLQATAEGERAIVEAVLNGMPGKITSKTRVAELYAGCGTLTFALAGKVRVAAFEGDTATIGALKQAINQGGVAGRIEAFQRDLARQPLSAKELKAFAAVVLDPPHGGAAAQIGQIAAAGVPTVVYVSCNPATLSRDARMLNGAGYTLAAVTVIDQFLWSARVESVSVFRRT